MSTSSKGSARERQVKKRLEAEGWVCVRSAASASPVDIWAIKASGRKLQYGGANVLAIQIKANKGNPYMNFRKPERDELRTLSEQAGATPYLVHWPPHGEETWYGESDWPSVRES